MTTMLEKAARAIAVEYYGPAADENEAAMASEQWPGFLALARAALQAIREPDDLVCQSIEGFRCVAEGHPDIGKWVGSADDSDSFVPVDVFTAMIDAILSEGEA